MKKRLIIILFLLGSVCYADSSFIMSKTYQKSFKFDNEPGGFICQFSYYKDIISSSTRESINIKVILKDKTDWDSFYIDCAELKELKAFMNKIVWLSESETFVKYNCNIRAELEKVYISGYVFSEGKCNIRITNSSATCAEFNTISDIKRFISGIDKAMELNSEYLKEFNSVIPK